MYNSVNFTLNIVFGNSIGLSHDAEILSHSITHCHGSSKIRVINGKDSKLKNIGRLVSLIIDKYILKRKQVSIHLEGIYQEVKPFSDINILIPNQEWFRGSTENLMDDSVKIWCKTYYAVTIFKQKYKNVSFVGFSSRDLLDKTVKKSFHHFLHVAGKSEQKGTRVILDAWQKNPEWPKITVICRVPELIQGISAENITIISDFISEENLLTLMNRCGIHLCLSETEGFGHYIHEGMSTGSIVMATNAPPMNEFVDENCGFLVDFDRQSEQYLSEVYYVSTTTLETSIHKLLNTPEQLLKKMSVASRNRFLAQKASFTKSLCEQLKVTMNE